MWGWILHFTPASILSLLVLSIFALGLILTVFGFLGSKIPFISTLIPATGTYTLVAKVLGIVLLLFGSWMKGAFDVEMVWRDRAAKIEAKLKIAEEKSKHANVVIQEKVVKEIQVVHDVQTVIQERIIEVEKIIDGQCKVDPVAISILNQAVHNTITKPEETEKPKEQQSLNFNSNRGVIVRPGMSQEDIDLVAQNLNSNDKGFIVRDN